MSTANDPTRQAFLGEGTRVDVAHSDQSPRRAKWRIVGVAILGIMLLAIIAIVWATSGGTQVPKVVGEQRAAAVTTLAKSGLQSKILIVDAVGEKAGQVITQSAGAGAEVDDGSTVTLTVASGKVAVPAAKLLGSAYDVAVTTLTALGLKASRSDVVSSMPSGTVIAVNPQDFAVNGSTVTLTVAVAPTPDQGGHNGKNKGKGGKD